eukprot:g9019.t1
MASSPSFSVVAVDASVDGIDAGRKRIEQSLSKILKRKSARKVLAEEDAGGQKEEILSRITYASDLNALAHCDLVIEAATENPDIKMPLFKDLARITSEDCILASNTSSLSIKEMAMASGRPSHVVGMHFFNPVQMMKLVEVVRCEETDPAVFEKCRSWAQAIDKHPVTCSDTPGFIVNRLLVPGLAQGMLMLDRGDASAEDIDKSMELGAGWPMGPMALADYVGLDICLSILDGTADVQAELKEYLNSKNINSLFIQIVERLLIEKPDNPIGFIVEYLAKRYPEETRAAKVGHSGSHRAGSLASNITTASSRVESEEEQTDSEDDEYLDDIDLQPTTVPKKIVRRESVSAEQVGANTKPPELKKVPKSEAESARIHELLRENIMFKHLDSLQTDQVKDTMFLVEHEPDDVVIREGDAGDNFYVIDEGTFNVYIKKEGVETKVKSMGPGESFGELALMYSTPRTATCKAVTKARLWALDRISFKVILQATTTARRTQHKSFLESVPTLEQLTEYEILTIADALVEDSYEDGDVICTQGEVGDAFYIIKKGAASVIQTDALGESQEIAHLDTGHYFGEVALIFAQPRGATVKAVGPLQLLSLDRRTFKRVMGPMETILKRNMKAYKRIAASNI